MLFYNAQHCQHQYTHHLISASFAGVLLQLAAPGAGVGAGVGGINMGRLQGPTNRCGARPPR